MKNIFILFYLLFFIPVITFAQVDKPKEYDGDWFNNKRHGQGKCVYWNNNVYEGQWRFNFRHGKGKLVFANGDIFDGEFEAGSITGYGIFTYSNGEKYTGHLANGIYHGMGEKQFKNGNIYKGNWDDGEISGKGKMIYANGDFYDGYWYNGKKNGLGQYVSQKNNSYKGEWAFDKYNGSGELSDIDGNIYKGDFVDGKKSGKGELKGIDGDYYFGDWDRNKYNGFGSLTIAGGDKYIGNFKNGKYEGSGKLNTADGTQITGEFENGKIEGTANIEKKDGTKYYGEFDKGEYEGEGNLTLPNGDFYKGEFKNGKFNKHGILYYSKGGYFNGGWWNGRRYGLGEEVDANGNIIEEGKYGGKKGRLLMTTAQMKRAQVAQDELLRTMRGMQEQMAYQKKQQSEYQKKIAKRNSENDAILAEYTKISKARSQYLEDVKAGKMNYDPEKYKNPYKVNSNTTSQNNTVNNTNTSNNNTSINKTTVKKTVKLEPKYKVGQQVTVINKGVNINDGVKGNYPRAQIRIAKVLEYDKYFHKKYPFQEFHMIESRSAKRNNIAYIRMEDGFEYQYIIDGWAVNEAYEIRYEALYNNKVLKELWVFSSMGEIIEYRKGNNKIIWRYGHENNGISVICYQISNGNNYASYKFGYNPSGKHTTTWFSKKQYQFSTGEDWQWVRGEREESAIQEAKAFLPNLFNYKSFKPQKRVY